MPEINPKTLRVLRERKHFTLDELSTMAKVDRGTISKIENGSRINPRPSTIRKLAEALGVEAQELASADIEETERSPLSPKSQMNIRMGNDTRNALHLTAIRYDVKPSHILHLAPLLFRWAAEMSLQRRRERLAEVTKHLDALSKVEAPQHLTELVSNNWRGDEALFDEERSINKRDLFGLLLNDDSLAEDYEESEQNPMAQFLKSISASLGDDVDFEYWSPHWSQPGYTIGKAEALGLVGGDEGAAHQIVSGYAPLHELPKNVRDQGPDAVAHWALETGKQEMRKLIDVDALMVNLGIDDE